MLVSSTDAKAACMGASAAVAARMDAANACFGEMFISTVATRGFTAGATPCAMSESGATQMRENAM